MAKKRYIKQEYVVLIDNFEFVFSLSANRLCQSLPDEARHMWPHRLIKNYVILIDADTKENGRTKNCAIDTLREILTEVRSYQEYIFIRMYL